MDIKLRSNLVGGIICIAFAIILWFIIPLEVSLLNNNSFISARFVPRFLAIIIFIGGGILAIQSLIKQDNYITIHIKRELKAIAYMAVIVTYSYVLPFVGYLISSLALGLITLAMTGCKKKKYYLIVAALVIFLYVVFTFALKIKLP